MLRQRQGSALNRLAQVALAALLLGGMLMTSACGGDPQAQQQSTQNKSKLDSLLKHAKDIGVPSNLLQSVINQEQQLNSTGAPFALFNDQPIDDYYHNLSSRYSQLSVQVQGIITSTTEQLQTQAEQDMKTFQTVLNQQRSQKLPIDNFSKQYDTNQTLMTTAQYPKDYRTISSNAKTAVQSLNLMSAISNRLKTFKSTIDQMSKARLDVTAMQQQYQDDQKSLSSALLPADFNNLDIQISAQYQLAIVHSTQALPYVTTAKLNEFDQQIHLLQTYGMDASMYKQKLDADRAKMKKAMSLKDYSNFARQVDADMALMHDDLVKGKAQYMVKQLQKEVDAWNSKHKFHDAYDGQDYIYTGGYGQDGIGYYLNAYLSWAVTTEDYQAIADQASDTIFNLKMLQADLNDKTPYNKVHKTDMQLLNYYNAMKGQVIVVSMAGQALRLYQDGKLVRSFLVTTGRYERPSLPGFWDVQNRESPTVFKSTEPKDSPYWYPDTPIHFAILYHQGGYFIHDSWWRADYGPGTQFPHHDSGGDDHDAGNGSHGCVNMREDEAQWLYQNTSFQTKIIVY
jgi:lipoprotein-anchoring transpeptidase ErfK/SrfK